MLRRGAPVCARSPRIGTAGEVRFDFALPLGMRRLPRSKIFVSRRRAVHLIHSAARAGKHFYRLS